MTLFDLLTSTAPEYTAAQEFLRENLSPALTGDNWDALIAAAAVGDTYNRQNARLAFDQLFRSTASGRYLDRRMGDYGIQRPVSVGINDVLFRDLGIKLSNDALTNLTLWEVLETFYGPDATRATLTAGVAEPYALADGDTLDVQVDDREIVTVPFTAADFQDITAAQAVEVAAVVNRAMQMAGVNAYAVVYQDPSDGLNYVRVYSGALGMVGALRVRGGRAQNVLLFPTKLTTGTPTTQWQIQFNPTTNVVHMQFVGGADPLLDTVRVGDYVNIYGTPFHVENRGTFVVNAIFLDAAQSPRTTWIEFENRNAVTETVTQIAADDVLFYRSTRSSFPEARISNACKAIEITLPATTQVVNRTIGTGAYLHVQAEVTLASATRDATGLVTVVTATPHAMTTGSVAFIDGLDGGRLNGAFTVAVIDATTFTYSTPEFPFATTSSGGTVTPFAAPAAGGIPGPYMFDPVNGLSVTGTSSTIQTALVSGQNGVILALADASGFPDADGWLVLGYGTSIQQGPIRYSGRISNTQLLLDTHYTFKFDAPVGTDVTLLLDKSAWVPADIETVGAFYLTASSAGRIAASDTLDDTIAAGMRVCKKVVYPGDRGLGGEGFGTKAPKTSSKVWVWGGDDATSLNLLSDNCDCYDDDDAGSSRQFWPPVPALPVLGGGAAAVSCDLANKPVPPSFSFNATTGAIGTGPIYCSGPNGTTVDLNTGALLDGNVPLSILGAGTYIPAGLWWTFTQGNPGIAIYNVPAGFVVSNSMDIVGIPNWQGYFVGAGADPLNPGTWRAICFSGGAWIENAGAVAGNTGCFLIG